jgi:hypothetical protein
MAAALCRSLAGEIFTEVKTPEHPNLLVTVIVRVTLKA